MAGEIFFITNDEHWPFWDFQHTTLKEKGHVSEETDCSVLLRYPYTGVHCDVVCMGCFVHEETCRPFSAPACTRHWFSISKAQNVLGYKPSADDTEDLKRMAKVSKVFSSRSGIKRTSNTS